MPSGAVLTDGDWDAVCAALIEHDVPLLYDAAMERLLFDGRPLVHPLHTPGMAERTVIVGSLSKEHRMIGWRVGWVAGPADLVESVGWTHVYNTTMPTALSPLPGRRGAARRPGARGRLRRRARGAARRDPRRARRLARRAPGRRLVDADRRDRARHHAGRAVAALLEDAAIAATPMLGWGGEVADRHVRLVYSAEPLDRLRTIPERFAGTRLAAYGSSPRSAAT